MSHYIQLLRNSYLLPLQTEFHIEVSLGWLTGPDPLSVASDFCVPDTSVILLDMFGYKSNQFNRDLYPPRSPYWRSLAQSVRWQQFSMSNNLYVARSCLLGWSGRGFLIVFWSCNLIFVFWWWWWWWRQWRYFAAWWILQSKTFPRLELGAGLSREKEIWSSL